MIDSIQGRGGRIAEALKRSYRNWLRMRRRVRPSSMPEPFFATDSIDDLLAHFVDQAPDMEELPDSQEVLRGECYVCQREVDFLIERPADGGPVNWRETLKCPGCELINRWRSCLHLFQAVCEPTELDHIYLTETLSPVYRQLEGQFPLLVGSEYMPPAERGESVEMHGHMVRHEDVTQLSFADRSLEAVLCFDVMEHVPDYRSALREFHRVLVRGGQLVLSVPFSFSQKTLVRAVVRASGGIEHLVEPCYHGDPLSSEGVLSYYDFGMDLLADLEAAGFREAFAVCYRDRRWGYLMSNVAFVARRL
jgi:SAM-dependent methyltransferase